MLLSVENAHKLIEKEIQKLNFDYSPANLYEPISYILRIGGKRLRPILSLYSYHIFSDDYKSVVKPSLALEVFHNFTLMHDDIMDKAPLRRGFQTVHEKWNANIAILSGDAMLVKAYQLFEGLDSNLFNEVLNRFNKTAIEVCEGQMLDMDFETYSDIPSTEQYIEMIRLKTSVLLGFSLELGAILGGAKTEVSKKLYNIGVCAGLGFQIKDDLLDLYGDVALVGKQSGGDILCNKKTFLLTKYFELASKEDRANSQKWLMEKKYNPTDKLSYFKSQFDKYHIKQISEDLISKYFDDSLVALDQLKVDVFKKGKLKSLLTRLIERES